MSMSNRIGAYLDTQEVEYHLIEHEHSHSSVGTAVSSHVPLKQIAKAVMLEDHEGRRLMAIIPANNKVNLGQLRDTLHRDFHLMREQNVYQLFNDCDPGAIPPLPEAYNLDFIYDDQLLDQPDVYIECGDHTHLVQLNQRDFRHLMHKARHMRFSHPVFH